MPTTNFHWDEVDDNVIMETTDNNVITQTYQHSPGRYGELISTRRDTTNWYYHYDGMGSTRKLTGGTQNITDTYIFDGFGNEVFQRGATTNPFRYKGAAGYYTNPVTDDIYVRARTYEPTTGRWLSRNPVGFVEESYYSRPYFVPGKTEITSKLLSDGGTCKFKICSKLVLGKGDAGDGHLFVICDDTLYRSGPGRWPGDKTHPVQGKESCWCKNISFGQLWPEVTPWDKKPLDHPENPDASYPKDEMICTDVEVQHPCEEVCGCFKRVAEALKACCIPYLAIPGLDGPLPGSNSNSFVGWMLEECVGKGDYTLPGIPRRLYPGIWEPIPKCLKNELVKGLK